MFALILLLLSAIGDVHVHEQTWDALWVGGREYSAITSCVDGVPAVWWARSHFSSEVLAHELAHVVDCLDDGELNGSPGHPRRLEPGVAYSAYCLSNRVEWYACEVVRTGRLR